MKYGGNSPSAVPAPHIKASNRTLLMIAQTVISTTLEVVSGQVKLNSKN
jgi:hypothetical protein